MAPLLPSASDELSGNLENADVNLLSRGKFPVSSLGAWSTPEVRRPPHDHCAASNPRIGLTSPRALLAGVFTMGVRRKPLRLWRARRVCVAHTDQGERSVLDDVKGAR